MLSGDTGVLEAAARTICAVKRQSVRDLYHAKWGSFSHRCRDHQVDPLHPSPHQVVDYLELLASVPVGHITLLTHFSALSACTYGCEEVSVGFHLLLSAWVKAHMFR